MRTSTSRGLSVILISAVLLLLFAPFGMILRAAFSNRAFLGAEDEGWSGKWFAVLFESSKWIEAAGFSFIVVIASTVLAVALGTVAAWGIFRASRGWAFLATGLYTVPLVLPPIVVALGIRKLFWGALPPVLLIILANVLVGVALVFLTVSGALKRIPKTELRAAELLASTWWNTQLRVVLPHCWPALFSGAVLTAFLAFDDVVFALFLGDPTTRTFSRLVWEVARQDASPISAAASSLWLVAVGAAAIFVFRKNWSERWLKAEN